MQGWSRSEKKGGQVVITNLHEAHVNLAEIASIMAFICSENTWVIEAFTTSKAVTVSIVKVPSLERQSMATKIAVCPLEGGSHSMKSMLIECPCILWDWERLQEAIRMGLLHAWRTHWMTYSLQLECMGGYM